MLSQEKTMIQNQESSGDVTTVQLDCGHSVYDYEPDSCEKSIREFMEGKLKFGEYGAKHQSLSWLVLFSWEGGWSFVSGE